MIQGQNSKRMGLLWITIWMSDFFFYFWCARVCLCVCVCLGGGGHFKTRRGQGLHSLVASCLIHISQILQKRGPQRPAGQPYECRSSMTRIWRFCWYLLRFPYHCFGVFDYYLKQNAWKGCLNFIMPMHPNYPSNWLDLVLDLFDFSFNTIFILLFWRTHFKDGLEICKMMYRDNF